MNVRVLDAYQDLLMGKTVEIVIELTIVPMKIHIELCLKQQFICVDVIEPQKPRVQSTVNY